MSRRRIFASVTLALASLVSAPALAQDVSVTVEQFHPAETAEDGFALAYVGEGEDISARIKSHDVNKDWWTAAILVTTAGNKLNKAHVRYLEARLIEEARKIGRTPLDNGTAPDGVPVSHGTMTADFLCTVPAAAKGISASIW